MPHKNDKYARIEAVLRRWAEPGRESYVNYAISLLGFVSLLDLAPFAKQVRARTARAQAKFGRTATEAKLKKFAFHVEAAIGVLNSFLEPAIAAHSSFGDGTARLALVSILNSAQAADLKHVPVVPKRGPSKRWKLLLMRHLAWSYFLVTGKHPTRSKNRESFTDFTREMLEAMRIKIGSLEYAVRCGCVSWRNGVPENPALFSTKRILKQ